MVGEGGVLGVAVPREGADLGDDALEGEVGGLDGIVVEKIEGRGLGGVGAGEHAPAGVGAVEDAVFIEVDFVAGLVNAGGGAAAVERGVAGGAGAFDEVVADVIHVGRLGAAGAVAGEVAPVVEDVVAEIEVDGGVVVGAGAGVAALVVDVEIVQPGQSAREVGGDNGAEAVGTLGVDGIVEGLGDVAPLGGDIVGVAGGAQDLVHGPGGGAVVENDIDAVPDGDGVVLAGGVGAEAGAKVADDEIVRADAQIEVFERDSAARGALAGDGYARFVDGEIGGEGDGARDLEEDGAAIGRGGGDGVAQRAGAGVGEGGDVVNVAAATAEGDLARALGAGEGGRRRDGRPAAEDGGDVTQGGGLGGVDLGGEGGAGCDVEGGAGEGGALVFPEAERGGGAGGVEQPADGGDMGVDRAVHEGDGAGGESVGVDAGEVGAGDAGRSGEAAIEKDGAVLAGGIAHLANVAAGERFDFATLEHGAAGAPDEVHVAGDEAVLEVGGVGGAVDEERILVAEKIAGVDDATLAVDAQGLGLGAALGRGVLEGEVVERDVGGGDVEKRAEGGAGVDVVVIWIRDDGAFAVLAAEGEIVFGRDPDDLLVSAVADVDVAAGGVVGGDQVDRALDGAEVGGAVGGDGEVGGRGGRRRGLGGEAPRRGTGNTGEAREDGGVDGDVADGVVGQDAGTRKDAGGVAGDEDGVGVVGDAGDSAGLGAVGGVEREVDGVEQRARGIVNLDRAGRAEGGGGVESDLERCVGADGGGAVGGEKADRNDGAGG